MVHRQPDRFFANKTEVQPANLARLQVDMIRERVRIRFRKEGDLRFISHRDLARMMERLFRRAALPLSMSQGFHPKPRMTFPSALAVGVAGLDEVMELELSESWEPDALLTALRAQAPAGLALTSLEILPPLAAKARVRQVTYETPLPTDREPDVAAAVARFLAQETHWITRADNGRTIDVRATVLGIELDAGSLRIILRVSQEGQARPREILAALGLDDLEASGLCLSRSQVLIDT